MPLVESCRHDHDCRDPRSDREGLALQRPPTRSLVGRICSLEREAQSTHGEGMATDVAVVAGMLSGRGDNDHIESCCRLEIPSQWVTAQSRPLDWMKRIGYQDRWFLSMCGLVGDHSFGLVGRAVWANARPGGTRIRNLGKGRLMIGPVISAGFASVWCSMAGAKDGSQ